MRVLHVGKFFAPFAGGIENFMLDLLRACSAGGVVQACLVHEAPGQRGLTGGAFDFLQHFRRVPTLGQVSYAPVSPGFGRALERMLVDFRPDVLHLHLPNTSAFWALRSRRARAIPWVVHWHSDVVGPGLDTKLKMLYPLYRPLEQALLRRAEVILATSPPYLDSSRALRPWRDKCRVIPLGLEPVRMDASPESGETIWRFPEKLKALAVGRLSRYKGFDVLMRAAREVEDVELVIAGSGEQHKRLERLLPAAAGDRIRLVGNVSDDRRNRLLAGCDLLCMPSLNRAEAFGLSLLEAMAAGKPAIATRVPGSGMGWVVQHERTGWLVEAGDAGALTATLGRLAADRSVLAMAGERARQRFETQFGIDAVAGEVVEVYKSLVA
ncbi:MAG: glycosyltransferase [Wenzhouxiangellaceae bacterium]